MNPQPEPIIRIKNLEKKFGKIEALRGLNMEVNRGDIYGFLGPNGSGKSTTIRILTSLVKSNGGELELFGMEPATSRNEILSRIGVLIERPNFYEHLSALRNLKILNDYAGLKKSKASLVDLLKLVELETRANDKVKTFSEGMKQRLGIAQALINDPELLILDEPFNSLDPQGVNDIRDIILKLNNEKGITILISSHDLDEIEKIVNRIVLINKGRAVAEGFLIDLLGKSKVLLKLEISPVNKARQVLEKANYHFESEVMENGQLTLSCHRAEIPNITNLLVQNNIDIFNVVSDFSLVDFFLSQIKK